MTDDVKKAVDRLRSQKDFYYLTHNEYLKDLQLVCGLYMAEHPATVPATACTTDDVKLTPAERKVLNLLMLAWNEFVKLGHNGADATDDFRRSIHEAQRLIAVRVAKRADKDIWN